ncbi:MAG: biopolymer transporter ExbD [Polyangiaceae bacterium]
MAVIQVGGGSHRGRALDHDLPLLPFIDFMLCLVAFLMLTAEWSHMGRLQALGSGPSDDQVQPTSKKMLHLTVNKDTFDLAWRDGSTVVETQQVPRKATFTAEHEPHYQDLATSLKASWAAHGVHRAPSDTAQDHAVLHTSNSLDFGEVAAVMDALAAPTRRFQQGAREAQIPAFAVSFASD